MICGWSPSGCSVACGQRSSRMRGRQSRSIICPRGGFATILPSGEPSGSRYQMPRMSLSLLAHSPRQYASMTSRIVISPSLITATSQSVRSMKMRGTLVTSEPPQRIGMSGRASRTMRISF